VSEERSEPRNVEPAGAFNRVPSRSSLLSQGERAGYPIPSLSVSGSVVAAVAAIVRSVSGGFLTDRATISISTVTAEPIGLFEDI
jgi:hypothetical protein